MEVPRNILLGFVLEALKWLAMVVWYSELVVSIVACSRGGMGDIGICALY